MSKQLNGNQKRFLQNPPRQHGNGPIMCFSDAQLQIAIQLEELGYLKRLPMSLARWEVLNWELVEQSEEK